MKTMRMGALLLGLLLVLTGCAKDEPKEVDPAVLADTLHTTLTFKDEMTAGNETMLKMLFEIDEADIEAFKIYESSGATAEELSLIHISFEKSNLWLLRKPP